MTYNVRSLFSQERLLELNEALKEIKYDIIGLAETRRTGEKIEEYENFILCHSGHTPGMYGIGFLVKRCYKNNIESFIGLTERVALLNVRIGDTRFSIIQVYAPTEKASEEEIEKFYKTVSEAIEVAHKDYILMGDLNAKIGQPKPEEYLIMRPNGYGERNDRGQRLIDFAIENKLSILNTYFKKKTKTKWTWRSPDWKYKNEIDFILSNRPRIFQNIEVLNINYPSDHRPIRATILLSNSKKSRINYTNNQNATLKNIEEVSKFKECLVSYESQNLLNCQENTSIQIYYDGITKTITKSLTRARTPRKTGKILTDHTLTLMKRRLELQKTKNKTRSIKNEISALYKLVSKHVKKDYANHRSKIIMKHLNQAGSTKKAYKELRSEKTWIGGLKHEGKTLYNRNEIITVATEYYKNLYSAREYNRINSKKSLDEKNIKDIAQIEVKEVIRAIEKLKMDKSPGSDSITNETLKTGSTILAQPLTNLFNRILEIGETPTQWSESNIILIYKKGDPKNVSNYRPISLLPCIYKLFSSIINKRISNTLELVQPIEQAGFRKGYSTVDHIHTLEILIEKYQEMQRPLYIAYIDYQKAFDTVSHASIWETLETQKVEEKYIRVIKNIYNNSKSRIKLETVGPWFPVQRGVRQGDPLSPTLFIATLEFIFNQLDWKGLGIKIKNEYLSHLRFADDLVLLAETSLELQSMIESLNEASKLVGLEINRSKTMLMTNSSRRIILVDKEPLKYTEQYIYLGKQIGFDQKTNDLEVERRTQLTWNKYWSLKYIFKSNMPIDIKTKILNTCLLPCLTYACQTWIFNNKTKQKIVTCQRGIERSMLNIRKIHKIRHSNIRKITKSRDGLVQALSLKWKWAGHVVRLQDNRWTKRVTIWKGPQGKRKKGRPYARWDDDLKKTAGPNWFKTAQSRETWQSLEEAFTCRGVLAKT